MSGPGGRRRSRSEIEIKSGFVPYCFLVDNLEKSGVPSSESLEVDVICGASHHGNIIESSRIPLCNNDCAIEGSSIDFMNALLSSGVSFSHKSEDEIESVYRLDRRLSKAGR